MARIVNIKQKIQTLLGLFKKLPITIKIVSIVIVLALIYIPVSQIHIGGDKITYQTQTVVKGTLIQSIDGSGTITSGNYTNVTTKASGVVSAVYVTNGDTVSKGQKIADVTLDEYAIERQSSAWASYLDALDAVKTAQQAKVTADLAMWTARQNILDSEEDIKYMNENPMNPTTKTNWTVGEKTILEKTLEEQKLAFSTAESKYTHADADIAEAQSKVSAALRTYQENSATIVAPEDGVISDLMLAQSIVVSASSTTSNTSGATIVSAQTVAKINHTDSQLIATISLTEVDITSVKANQKVTLTLDAFEDKTFTGKVLAVNTSGSVSSGVTSYPVTILLDKTDVDIYPNMAVSATIITNMETDVIMVPTTAIATASDGTSTVQVMQNKKPTTVPVELGNANDTNTVITSGVAEGDVVITATITSSKTTDSSSTTSPFSGVGSSTKRSSSGGMGDGMGRPPGF